MDTTDTIEGQADSLRALLGNRLGLRRGPLSRRVAKAGRRLPSSVRTDIVTVADAESMAQHPKIGRRMDPKATAGAYERAATFLEAIDVKDRRKGMLLSIAGSIAFNILAVITLLIVVLRWRGLV